MSSELVQNGFFDLEEVRNAEPMQVIYDYSRVTPEQADKLETIYNRMFMRHLRTEYEDGKDLLEAKETKDLPYEEFVEWVKTCYGWSEPIFRRKMNRAQYWGDFTVGSDCKIEAEAIDVLSTKRVPESVRQEAKALLNAGESINEERAKQLRDEQRAREKAEKDLETKEREFALFKQEVETNEQAHVTLVQSLEQKLEEKPEPEKVIEYQDTLETAANVAILKATVKAHETKIYELEGKSIISSETREELASLQHELKNAQIELGFYEKQNKDLADKNNQLSEESRRSFSENINIVGQLRIRQEWQYATGEVQAAIRKFHTKVPSEIDRKSFEGEENTRTYQTIEVLEQTAVMLKKTLLGSDNTVHADVFTVTIPQYQPALPDSSIPNEYQDLFAEYQQAVWNNPQPSLLWCAPDHNYTDQMREKEKHIQFTKELLRSGVDRRVRGAQEAMKRTLGTWEGTMA